MARIGTAGRVRCGLCGSFVGPVLEVELSAMRQGWAVPDRTVVVDVDLSDAVKSGLRDAGVEHGKVCSSTSFEVVEDA